MAEAMNDGSFLVTGADGKPLPKSMALLLRLHLPWKYGFKLIKGIVKISFVTERPIGMWEAIQCSEYGFWANVNFKVSHPRWSQAMEQVLGTGERVLTSCSMVRRPSWPAFTAGWKKNLSTCSHKKRPDDNPEFIVRLPWSGPSEKARARR